MVTETGRAITCKRKFEASSLETEGTKNDVPFENIGFNGNNLSSICVSRSSGGEGFWGGRPYVLR